MTGVTRAGAHSGRDLHRLLEALFEGETSAALFTVLRNDELLPDDLSGVDLDVCRMPGASLEEILRHITATARSVGWGTVCVSRRPHMIGFSLVSLEDGVQNQAVHLDVFDGISFWGMPLISPELLASESGVHRGVRQLSNRGRVLATAVHHLAWVGGFHKTKYRQEVAELLANPAERRWFLDRVRESLGTRIAADLENPAAFDALTSHPPRRRFKTLLMVLGTCVKQRPLSSLKAMANYFLGQIPSALHPPGCVGSPGDFVAGAPGRGLSLELACRLSPFGFGAKSVWAGPAAAMTLNGAGYERWLRTMWSRWTPLRWLAPSLFLWLQAKRNRVVVLDRLPLGIRLLRARSRRPTWIADPTAPVPGD
jgi:hypothetical protein